MKKFLFLINIVTLSLSLTAQDYQYNYSFFTNSAMPGDWYFSEATYGGGSTFLSVNGKIQVSEDVFFTPGNSLVLQYKNAAKGDWKAVVYRQEKRGMDVVFMQQQGSTTGWMTLYIDDIELTPAGQAVPVKQLPIIISSKGYAKHVDICWEKVTDPNVHMVKIFPGGIA